MSRFAKDTEYLNEVKNNVPPHMHRNKRKLTCRELATDLATGGKHTHTPCLGTIFRSVAASQHTPVKERKKKDQQKEHRERDIDR